MRLKLVSRKDTLLGHVDVPDLWGEHLTKHGAATAAIAPRMAVYWKDYDVQPFVVQTITLHRADWSQYRDAVYLEGTIEQLEAMRDCSFTPSMAYLRSHFSKDE